MSRGEMTRSKTAMFSHILANASIKRALNAKMIQRNLA